ncbi:hypothetical protein SUGI_0556080 [Cryptomeria japonica]|nr:hypothetical protein SUGI_0556080 [Cryptomeria japonica]
MESTAQVFEDHKANQEWYKNRGSKQITKWRNTSPPGKWGYEEMFTDRNGGFEGLERNLATTARACDIKRQPGGYLSR